MCEFLRIDPLSLAISCKKLYAEEYHREVDSMDEALLRGLTAKDDKYACAVADL